MKNEIEQSEYRRRFDWIVKTELAGKNVRIYPCQEPSGFGYFTCEIGGRSDLRFIGATPEESVDSAMKGNRACELAGKLPALASVPAEPQVDATLEEMAEQAALKLRLLPVGALNAERHQIVLDALTSAHAKSQPKEMLIEGSGLTPKLREVLTASVKWLDRILERRAELPASFLDNCNPEPLAKQIRELLKARKSQPKEVNQRMLDAIKYARPLLDAVADLEVGETGGPCSANCAFVAKHLFDELIEAAEPGMEREGIPSELLDGMAVFEELQAEPRAANRTSAENVADTLDAAVRLIRRARKEGGK